MICNEILVQEKIVYVDIDLATLLKRLYVVSIFLKGNLMNHIQGHLFEPLGTQRLSLKKI